MNRLVVSIFVLSLLSPGVGFPLGRRAAETPSESEAQKTSLQLVAEALVRGEIDEDTATLYRVYSVVDDTKLPPDYRGTAPIRDGTTVLRAARSRYDTLSLEIQRKLDPYLFPKGRK